MMLMLFTPSLTLLSVVNQWMNILMPNEDKTEICLLGFLMGNLLFTTLLTCFSNLKVFDIGFNRLPDCQGW